ncbi:MAG: hypothetical protein K2X38_22590 [Gemmataceae bacterium]|nr:hypothetical protein [Gemmataceae bacterium]
MDITRVRDAMAESCRNLWTLQCQKKSPLGFQELTAVETQAIVFAVIDGRAGVEVAEEEVERVLETAAEAKRVWCRLQAAMLGQATLRFDGQQMQMVTQAKTCENGGYRTAISESSERAMVGAN